MGLATAAPTRTALYETGAPVCVPGIPMKCAMCNMDMKDDNEMKMHQMMGNMDMHMMKNMMMHMSMMMEKKMKA